METTNKTQNRYAIGYVRVSTSEQKKYGNSLASQKNNIENFCFNNNIVLLKTFTEDYSGADFERPEFQKLLKFIKANRGEVDLLLLDRQDRFARNTELALSMTRKLKGLGVEVNFVSEWIDNVDTPEGKLISNIRYTMAESYRDRLIKITSMGTRLSLTEGRYTKTPPRGFKRVRNSKNKIVITPNEKAPLIKNLFIDYSLGVFSQKELITKYSKLGLGVTKSSLSRMLTNVLYAGYIDLNKHNIHPYNLKRGEHKAIISMELFQKVQDIKNKRNSLFKNSKVVNEKFPLSGFLECPKCGEKLIGSNSNNGNSKKIKRYYYYYECKSKNGCRERYPAATIHNMLELELVKLKPNRKIQELFKEILIEEYEKFNSERLQMLSQIEDRLGSISKLTYSLKDKLIRELITEQDFKDFNKTYSSDKAKLEREKKELEGYHKDLQKLLEYGLNLICNFDALYKKSSYKLKKRLLGSILEDSIVFSNNNFRTLNFKRAINLISKFDKALGGNENKKGGNSKITSHTVLEVGIEPTLPKELDFESSASTNSATRALLIIVCKSKKYF